MMKLIKTTGLTLFFVGFSVSVFAKEVPVVPTNTRIIYEGGQAVGKGSVREYSERTGSSGSFSLNAGSGKAYNTRIEIGTVYPDSYYYDYDYRYPRRHHVDDYFRWKNRMRLEARRKEAQNLSPKTNNRLYNEVVTQQRLKERRRDPDAQFGHPPYDYRQGERIRIEWRR
ncbi:Uncharacterised protein [Neisseria canis]|uniref:Periplasmic protein n=1 Tax=Neisseria canis TaxID=493 RepID=A0A448D950_9NEIS|nr:Uncharacterised protein [Neisseria canis]